MNSCAAVELCPQHGSHCQQQTLRQRVKESAMFDETNWNRPFGFENLLTVNTAAQESDELLDLLNESFFDDEGAMDGSKCVTEYQAKTQMKMSKIFESARQVSRTVTPKSSDIKTEEVVIKMEPNLPSSLVKRACEIEMTPAAKAARVRKPKVTPAPVVRTVSAQPLPPVSKLIQFSTRYVDMYVNVMNSGSFMTIQKFLYKYMSRPCKLLVGHDVRATFRVPKLSTAEGPALMAHYFLGCLVMFPDMLVDLKSSSTVTSPEGRRIVMRVETHATKSVDLPMEDWMPVLASLQDTYTKFLTQPVSSSQAREDVVEAHLQAQNESTYTRGLADGPEVPPLPAVVPLVVLDGNTSDSENSMSTITTATADSTPSLSPSSLYENIPLIPESYVKSLYRKAKLLPTPKPLVLRGTITLQLDGNDHIYDITTDFVQVNA